MGIKDPEQARFAAIRQDGRALVHQALGGAGHRRIAPNADFEANALNRLIGRVRRRPMPPPARR